MYRRLRIFLMVVGVILAACNGGVGSETGAAPPAGNGGSGQVKEAGETQATQPPLSEPSGNDPAGTPGPSDDHASDNAAANRNDNDDPENGNDNDGQDTSSMPAAALALALEDAVARRRVARDAITVQSAEQVQWSDGSMGCPAPDTMYTQAIVDGYEILLNVDGQVYDYRVSDAGVVVLCANGRPAGPPSGTSDNTGGANNDSGSAGEDGGAADDNGGTGDYD